MRTKKESRIFSNESHIVIVQASLFCQGMGKKTKNRINKSEIRLQHNTLYIHTNIPYLYIIFCRIKTEKDFKNKISSIAKWTNDQGQSERGDKRTHQGIVEEKN